MTNPELTKELRDTFEERRSRRATRLLKNPKLAKAVKQHRSANRQQEH